MRHRLPWLIVGLVGAFVAADIVAVFEERLKDRVILAFFIPGVVYLADAVGTQTETIVIRGLPLGIPVQRMFRREIMTGVVAGLLLGGIFYPVALVRWGEADVALAVAIALFAACVVATIVGMVIPWALLKMRSDPAFATAPISTVIQDIASILIYFLVAAALID